VQGSCHVNPLAMADAPCAAHVALTHRLSRRMAHGCRAALLETQRNGVAESLPRGHGSLIPSLAATAMRFARTFRFHDTNASFDTTRAGADGLSSETRRANQSQRP